jgi:hypothetical protein
MIAVLLKKGSAKYGPLLFYLFFYMQISPISTASEQADIPAMKSVHLAPPKFL